jgi:hypothetical protein
MSEAIDIIARHGLPTTSFAKAVQEVMDMNAMAARRLLSDLVDFKVEHPGSFAVTKLAAAFLVQTEVKFRLQNGGETVMPFNEADYRDALAYAVEHAPEHERVYAVQEADGAAEPVEGDAPKKRGRKGSVWPMVVEFFKDNPDLSPNDAAKALAEKGLNESSARVYWYKCIKMNKAGEL